MGNGTPYQEAMRDAYNALTSAIRHRADDKVIKALTADAFAGIPFNSHRYPDPQNDKAEAQQEKANATATTDTTLVATGGGRTINSTSAKKKGKEGGTSRPGGTSKVKAPGRRTRPLVCIPSEGPGGFFSLVRIGNANSHISPSETGGLRGHGRRAAQQAGEKNKR